MTAHEPIIIELPGEPIGKGRPRFVRSTGRVYTPPKTEKYETDLAWMARLAMKGRQPLEGALVVDVIAMMPVPKSWPKRRQQQAEDWEIYPLTTPDGDNLLKVLDALNGIVWGDDKQIVDARIRKRYSREPRLRIAVQAIEPDAPPFLAPNPDNSLPTTA